MVDYPLDRALEELEDISNREQTGCWLSCEFGLFETGPSGIAIGFEEKEFENWIKLGEYVNPRADPDERQFFGIESVGATLVTTMIPTGKGITVMSYDLSNVARPTTTPMSGAAVVATYYCPYTHSLLGSFIGQPRGSTSSSEQRVELPELPYAEWSFCGDMITIYSREPSAEATRLATIEAILRELQVPYEVDRGVLPIVNELTLQALNIVTSILADEVSRGLPVKQVNIEPLTDRDAGQWSEVVLKILVDLNSSDANREWDDILDKVSEVADRQTDRELTTSLLEKIGIHFVWVAGSGV